MAKSKQCDRCGAFYVETAPTAFQQLIKNAADTFKFITGTNEKEQIRQIIESNVDFCPDCSHSLDKWLNEKEKDNG